MNTEESSCHGNSESPCQKQWWSLFIEFTEESYSSDSILFILYRTAQGQLDLFLTVIKGGIRYSFQIWNNRKDEELATTLR